MLLLHISGLTVSIYEIFKGTWYPVSWQWVGK